MNKTLKVFLALLFTAFSVVVFGLCLPIALIAFKILPNLGIGSFIYLGAGGIIGLIYGIVHAYKSLYKNYSIKKYTMALLILAVLTIVYFILFYGFPELFARV